MPDASHNGSDGHSETVAIPRNSIAAQGADISEESALTAEDLALESSSPEGELAVEQALEDILARSPAQAIALVEQIDNPVRREQMLCLTVRL